MIVSIKIKSVVILFTGFIYVNIIFSTSSLVKANI